MTISMTGSYPNITLQLSWLFKKIEKPRVSRIDEEKRTDHIQLGVTGSRCYGYRGKRSSKIQGRGYLRRTQGGKIITPNRK